ncbi:MAG: Fe-Mn family superoxide dismutase [Phenylobacterium sp.]|uniref:superoxide dismutase n=1 Tax=Phenylobacterium sp. TaxID=1871053 RepID=UPI002733034F|nr:Fe-Mn family superoxide dismutase [Phenylobacterium sp.]MDP3115919.1 Fe-Mn family superoxide dismutase [Phenylobacterium sp.]
MIDPDRRTLLAAAAGLATAAPALAAPEATGGPPAAAAFTPKPLPFDPAKVPGLSEKLIRSHYDNNYTGAVKRLAAIKADFAKLDMATAPTFLLNGLKREELLAWNSMVLHEVHFEGFGERDAPSAQLARAIERDFGTHDRWAAEFSAMGKALGGGSGWVLLTWSERDQRLVNQWGSDHTQTLADGRPLLALDMYEHAYHMDYGAKAAAYVDAYMKVFAWKGANTRFARATAA